MTHAETHPDMLDEQQLAAELQIPERTLSMWRYRGKGPAYAKVGRHVRYRRADVERWLVSQTVDPTHRGGNHAA